MEDVDSGVAEGEDPLFEFFAVLEFLLFVVVDFPLAEAIDDGEIGADCGTDSPGYFKGEAHAFFEAAAVFVCSLVVGGAEEGVEEVTMGAVNFEGVTAHLFSGFGGAYVGVEDLLEVVGVHGADFGAWCAVGAVGELVVTGSDGVGGEASAVPELGGEGAARGVDGVDDFFPGGVLLGGFKAGDGGGIEGVDAVDAGAFGDDEPDFALGASFVVLADFLGGDAVFSGFASGHGGHDDAVAQGHCFEGPWFEGEGVFEGHEEGAPRLFYREKSCFGGDFTKE